MLTGIVVGPDQKGGQAAIIYAAGANNNGTPAEKKLHYLTRTIDLEMKEVEGNDTVSLKSIYGATVQWGDPETYDIGSTGFGMNEWPTDMGTTMFGFRPSSNPTSARKTAIRLFFPYTTAEWNGASVLQRVSNRCASLHR